MQKKLIGDKQQLHNYPLEPQDDHQIPHRGINSLQPLLPQSEDRTTLPLLPPAERAPVHEDRYEAVTAGVEG